MCARVCVHRYMYATAASPVDGVSVRGPYELLQQVLDVPSQPLVPLLQVKDLIHQEQHHSQRDVVIHLQGQRARVKGHLQFATCLPTTAVGWIVRTATQQ